MVADDSHTFITYILSMHIKYMYDLDTHDINIIMPFVFCFLSLFLFSPVPMYVVLCSET